MTSAALRKAVVASPLFAAVAYAGIVSLLLVTVIASIAGIFGQWADVTSLATLLDQLEGRKAATAGRSTDASMPSGSAFLDGATVTIAGATLIHRVEGAVIKYGGSVLSTQVDLKGTQSKAGFISVLASCEINQIGL